MRAPTLLFFLIGTLPVASQSDADWRDLLPKDTLEAWSPSAEAQCWQVTDGILRVKNSPEKKGSILWTRESFRNFLFQTDFRMLDGIVDSGIFLRSEANQIQIGISGSLKTDRTASPYLPGKGYPVEAAGVPELLRTGDWNTLMVRCSGDTYQVWLNGTQVLDYTSASLPPEGPVGLQLHPGNIMEIHFRKIQVKTL